MSDRGPGSDGRVPRAPILEVRNLGKTFRLRRQRGSPASGGVQVSRNLRAVNDVSFSIAAGEALALVGESGSGKSTVARCVAGLIVPTEGEILLGGRLVKVKTPWSRKRYWRDVQMVFQDPFSSLNPVQTVRHQLARPLLNFHRVRRGASLEQQLEALLETVQLVPPEQFLDKLPHELSGGQRQRVAVARALAPNPKVLLADEPVSMLDVSIRLGLLNLLARLKTDERLAMLYITHDIASARYFSERILVMYRGEVVESGPAEAICTEPVHPYTRLLVAAAPDPARRGRGEGGVRRKGPEVVSTGCTYAGRCPWAVESCRTIRPAEVVVGSGRVARCSRLEEIARSTEAEAARKP